MTPREERVLDRLIGTRLWWRKIWLLKRNSWLLTSRVEIELADQAECAKEEGEWARVFVAYLHRALVVRAREVGARAAVREARATVELIPACVDIGGAAIARYHDGEVAALDEAVDIFTAAADITPSPHPTRAPVLANLGHALWLRYDAFGNDEDLTHSSAVLDEAERLPWADPGERTSVLVNLGVTLLELLDAGLSEADALARAEKAFTEAVPLAGDSDREAVSGGIGTVALTRHQRTVGGAPDALNTAVTAFRDAVDQARDDPLRQARQLNNLGVALSERYTATSALADLQESVAMHQRSVAQTPLHAPDLPDRQANLAAASAERYDALGDPADWQEAHESLTSLVDGPWDARVLDHPNWRFNLGLVLQQGYERTGELALLDQAVEQLDAAANQPAPDTVRVARLDQLAVTLRKRALLRGEEAVLRHAIDVHRSAAELTDVAASQKVVLLGNYAGTVRELADLTGSARHRARALALYREAYRHAPASGSARAAAASNLAAHLVGDYNRTRVVDALRSAIGFHREAVELTEPNATALPARLHNLAIALRRACVDGIPGIHGTEVTGTYRAACLAGRKCTPEVTLRAATSWAEWALARKEWDEAVEADGHVRWAVDELVRRQAVRADRAVWLRQAINGSDAVVALHRTGQVEKALARLEWGRARLLSDAIASERATVDALRTTHPDLADRYQAAVANITRLENARDTPTTWRVQR